MRYGYIVQDSDMGMQLRALDSAGYDQVFQGELSDVVSLLKSDDVLVVWRIDKLAATISGLEKVLNDIHQAGASVELVFEKVNSSLGNESMLSQLIDIMKQVEKS